MNHLIKALRSNDADGPEHSTCVLKVRNGVLFTMSLLVVVLLLLLLLC